MKPLLWATIGFVVATALGAHSMNKNGDPQSEIARALSAAPFAVDNGARVVTIGDEGKIEELQKGSNGWTCVTHDPGTPMGHPLCLDRNGLTWMEAAMMGHPPDADKIGYGYMLKGGTSWSNTDVSATKLPAGQKDFIRIPPHFMIMNARLANSSGFPSGETYPDTHKPFVIYGGTPYAVLMIPLE